HEDRAVVVTDQARLDVEPLPQFQRLAEGDGLAGDDGVPAVLLQDVEQSGAGQQIPTPQVEQRQIAAVVHVPQQIDVAGEGGEPDATDLVELEPPAASHAESCSQDHEEGSPDHI